MKYLTWLFTLLFITSQFSSYGQDTPALNFEMEGATYSLEEFLELKKVNGASICLINAAGEEHLIQAGFREREADLPVTATTLFQAGSMTGAIVHFAVLRLVNDGKIKLDAPANDYLRTWQINKKRFTRKQPITVRDLLLQTRGFKKGYKPTGYQPGQALPNLQQILRGESPAEQSAVRLVKNRNKNENSDYANVLILQHLLEEVHGKPLAEILQTEVFQPLAMTHSVLCAELSPDEQQNAAVGYDQEGTPIPGKRWNYPELAHSGLWSTPTDYARFAFHVLQAAQGKDNRFLNQALALEGIEPQFSNNALIFHKWDLIGWGGASRGFRTQFNGHPEKGWISVVFMNSHENWKVMGQVQRKCGELLEKF